MVEAGVIEVQSSDQLTEALDVLAALESEARNLPDAIRAAIDETSAEKITTLRQREESLSVMVWAARARVLKLQINQKEQEREEILPQLERLDAQIGEETEIYRGIKDAEFEQRVLVQSMSARAGIIESRRQSLFEEISELKRELGQLMAARINKGGNGYGQN